MNLLSKLKPEFKAQLCDVKEEYPAMFKSLMKTLKEKNYIIELTIGEAKDLVMYTHTMHNKFFADIYELFNND